jgi:hypothetical protein
MSSDSGNRELLNGNELIRGINGGIDIRMK